MWMDSERREESWMSVEELLHAANPEQMFVLIIKLLRNYDIKVTAHLCTSLVVCFLFK